MSGCSSESTQTDSKTKVSKAISADRVKIVEKKVWFDGRNLGPIDLGEKREYADLPKTLPNGIHSYKTTELDDDLLLLSGGFKPEVKGKLPMSTDETFLWDRKKRALEEGPRMSCPRVDHEVTRLEDGRLLITGGMSLLPEKTYAKEVDIFEPTEKAIKKSGSLIVDRIQHSVLQIDTDRVLIVGGQTYSSTKNGMETSSIEVYSLSSGVSRDIGSLSNPRQGGTLFKLDKSRVLVVGGYNSSSEANSIPLPPEEIHVPD